MHRNRLSPQQTPAGAPWNSHSSQLIGRLFPSSLSLHHRVVSLTKLHLFLVQMPSLPHVRPVACGSYHSGLFKPCSSLQSQATFIKTAVNAAQPNLCCRSRVLDGTFRIGPFVCQPATGAFHQALESATERVDKYEQHGEAPRCRSLRRLRSRLGPQRALYGGCSVYRFGSCVFPLTFSCRQRPRQRHGSRLGLDRQVTHGVVLTGTMPTNRCEAWWQRRFSLGNLGVSYTEKLNGPARLVDKGSTL